MSLQPSVDFFKCCVTQALSASILYTVRPISIYPSRCCQTFIRVMSSRLGYQSELDVWQVMSEAPDGFDTIKSHLASATDVLEALEHVGWPGLDNLLRMLNRSIGLELHLNCSADTTQLYLRATFNNAHYPTLEPGLASRRFTGVLHLTGSTKRNNTKMPTPRVFPNVTVKYS